MVVIVNYLGDNYDGDKRCINFGVTAQRDDRASPTASSCNATSSWQKEARNFWGKVWVVAGLVGIRFALKERIPPEIIVVVHPEK